MIKSMRFVYLLSIVLILVLLPVYSLAENTVGLDNFQQVNTCDDGFFVDVSSTDWFYENVKRAFEFGLMVGKGGDIFDSEGTMTIAEVITVATRLHSIYYTGALNLEPSSPWYQSAVDYCQNNGIADASKYDMKATATKAEVATIFSNTLPDEVLEPINTVVDDAIPDVRILKDYGSAVYKLYRAGIYNGIDPSGAFSPDSNVTRAEVAAIATRLIFPELRKVVRLETPYAGDTEVAIVSDEMNIGSTFIMGNYGGEAIEWRVLAANGNERTLISVKGLDAVRFNQQVTKSDDWETSYVREWLNGTFWNEAFNEKEKAMIVPGATNDNVWLLNEEEAESYFEDDADRICKATEYAAKNGAWTDDVGACWWWLRSPGRIKGLTMSVYHYGHISNGGDTGNYNSVCVRPVVIVHLGN